MKKNNIAAILMISIAFLSCKKDKKSPVGLLGPNFANVINSIVTPAILDSLKKGGLPINPGLTPANIDGIYLLSPDYCIYDNTNTYVGSTFSDELEKFSNQNTEAYSVAYAYNQGDGSEVGVDNRATYISGTGNLFTVYAQALDTLDGVPSVDLRVMSGELTTGGIKNLYQGVYIVSKGNDPNGDVAPIGTTRVVKDGDGFSQTEATFSISPVKIQTARNKRPLQMTIGAAGKH